MNLKQLIGKTGKYTGIGMSYLTIESYINTNDQTEVKESIIHYIDEFSRGFEKENSTLKNIIDIIKNSIEGGTGNNFISIDIASHINSYKDFLSTLTLEQTGALANILCAMVILFCLITLISIFFSDILLTYFKIAEKYPKIGRIIKLRHQFQKFYFIWNSLLIFIAIFTIIFINILSFY